MKVRNNKKGFTLIELLAVIVILGLLMAIAIPSVTKYITESRKKTLTTTVGNYISALVNEVNDLSYTFTGQNTIYAVPIECIALERGGTNPFGHWYQANDAYFAYVLIQYDDSVSKYIYGFTFKDSAGYGLYPTIQANINERGTQVKTGYTINKPKTGELTSLVTLAKWQESGFKVDSNTKLQVLEATSEREVGNGINTCTLQQKGDNYAQVEEEKDEKDQLKKVPTGAVYTTVDGITINPGEDFPAEVKTGDIYVYDDYMYRYNQNLHQSNTRLYWDTDETQNGWGVAYLKNTAEPPQILKTINGKPITSLEYTFAECTALAIVPTIPDTVTILDNTYFGCTSLTDENLPKIPTSVTSMYGTFYGCKSLVDISDFKIPDSVVRLPSTFQNCTSLTTLPDNFTIGPHVTITQGMFQNCTSLTGTIIINTNTVYKNYMLTGTTQPITITGTSTRLNEIAQGLDNVTVIQK